MTGVMDAAALSEAHAELRDRLIHAGLLIPTGAAGLYGRDERFERVVAAIDAQVCNLAAEDGPERVEFPPVLTRATFDRVGYLQTFPQLAGAVFSFSGGDREHAALVRRLEAGDRYADALDQTDFALAPACCYPVYPAATGTLGQPGRIFELSAYCFRHEPSIDPMRMVAFRQREHVRLGTADQVLEWRARWMERVPAFFAQLDLDVATDVASDAFFGRAGRLMSSAQVEQELKFEFRVPVYGEEHATACASLNYHQSHFGDLFEIRTADGSGAHSSCIGFGLERCAVALFAVHGTAIDRWSDSVKARLW